MKGCGWVLAILGLGALMLLAMLASAMPDSGQSINIGARPTATPRGATVMVQTVNKGKIEQPSWKIGLWGIGILVALYVTAQMRSSGEAAGHGGTAAGFATVAVIVVVICIFIGVISMTLGGG